MKQHIRAIVMVGFLLVLAGASAIAQMPQPFSADFTQGTANGRKVTGKWYLSGPKMRMEMNAPQQAKSGPFGGNMVMIVDSGTKTAYMLMAQAQMYMEIPASGARDMQGMQNLTNLAHGSDPCAGNPDFTCKKVGTETINGRSCDKWEMTGKNGHKSTAWVDQKLYFPIHGQDSEGNVWDFTNIKEGAQDASLFVVPPGYRKFDAAAMGRTK